MEAGRNMVGPNSPEGSQHHEGQEELSDDIVNSFDPPTDEDAATVQTENRENARDQLRHPGEVNFPYASYYRPPLEWRPPPQPFHSYWHHYPSRAHLPPPHPPFRGGDILPPFEAGPRNAHPLGDTYHQQQNNESAEPLSPPDYRASYFHHGHTFGFPRQLKWPEDSPRENNRQSQDYAFHPSHQMTLHGDTDNSQGSPTPPVEQDHLGSTEFSGRRFIPTDTSPPPAVYIPPQRAVPSPPPPPPPPPLLPPGGIPTQAPPKASPRARDSPGVKKRKALHPGSQGEYIWETYDCDILCGRGVPTSQQWGNKMFKQLVQERQMEYIACERNSKSRLSNEVIEIIRSYNGRFLRRVKVPDRRERFAWVELTAERAYEKVCQALRDGGPRIRKAMKALDDMERIKRDTRTLEKENTVNCPRK